MKGAGHANIPLFIPHMGCPHNCVFCDQKSISGRKGFDLAAADKLVSKAISTLGGRKAELAFFGGSFTAIDRTLMISLLELAARHRDAGELDGIRLSTRPDCVGEEILDILDAYGVTAIELGVQSMDDSVLQKSGRGHTAKDTEDAFRRITARKKFSLCGQMMLGLPGSDREKELHTAERICEMGADSTRIYPTAVLRDTPLAAAYEKGLYTPLTLGEGVGRGAECKKIFDRAGVKVLRMGLCAEESCESAFLAGCFHPAYGELVESRLYLEKLNLIFENDPPSRGNEYTVFVARGALSRAVGHKKENKEKIMERYRCRLQFAERADLPEGAVVIEEGNRRALKIT